MGIPGKASASPEKLKKKVFFAYLKAKIFHPITRSADLESPASLPLGLACVKAYAASDREISKKALLTGRMFGSGMTEKAVASALAAQKPDVAAFSCFILNESATLGVCRRLKRLLPGVRILLGGASVPRSPARLAEFMKKNPALDAAVFGEGEIPFAKWLKARLSGAEPARMDGLALRGPKGLLIGRAPCVPDFNTLPSPYLSGAAVLNKKNGGLLPLETARGCPFLCAYCATDAAQRALRFFPLERLRRELAWLKKLTYKGLVWIVDPIINLDRDRAAGIFRLLAGFSGQCMINLKPEFLDDRLIGLLGNIPGVRAVIGVQTVNPETLRNIGRKSDVELSAANIRKLLRHKNVVIVLQLILGLPGDNYEKFKATLDWALSFGRRPNINVYDLLILDNSGLSRMAEKFSIKTKPDGTVTENYSFSGEDFMKAGWCMAVYHAISRSPGALGMFERACGREGSPSRVLERLAFKAVKHGLIPRKRLVIDSLGSCGNIDAAFLKAELDGAGPPGVPAVFGRAGARTRR